MGTLVSFIKFEMDSNSFLNCFFIMWREGGVGIDGTLILAPTNFSEHWILAIFSKSLKSLTLVAAKNSNLKVCLSFSNC